MKQGKADTEDDNQRIILKFNILNKAADSIVVLWTEVLVIFYQFVSQLAMWFVVSVGLALKLKWNWVYYTLINIVTVFLISLSALLYKRSHGLINPRIRKRFVVVKNTYFIAGIWVYAVMVALWLKVIILRLSTNYWLR